MYHAKSNKKVRFELTLICACTQTPAILIIFVELWIDCGIVLKKLFMPERQHQKTCFVCQSGSVLAVQLPALEDITLSLNISLRFSLLCFFSFFFNCMRWAFKLSTSPKSGEGLCTGNSFKIATGSLWFWQWQSSKWK